MSISLVVKGILPGFFYIENVAPGSKRRAERVNVRVDSSAKGGQHIAVLWNLHVVKGDNEWKIDSISDD